jgi:hypothetical protein
MHNSATDRSKKANNIGSTDSVMQKNPIKPAPVELTSLN